MCTVALLVFVLRMLTHSWQLTNCSVNHSTATVQCCHCHYCTTASFFLSFVLLQDFSFHNSKGCINEELVRGLGFHQTLPWHSQHKESATACAGANNDRLLSLYGVGSTFTKIHFTRLRGTLPKLQAVPYIQSFQTRSSVLKLVESGIG
jgi:hypothetical protein